MMTLAMNDDLWLSSLPEGAEFSLYATLGKKKRKWGVEQGREGGREMRREERRAGKGRTSSPFFTGIGDCTVVPLIYSHLSLL